MIGCCPAKLQQSAPLHRLSLCTPLCTPRCRQARCQFGGASYLHRRGVTKVPLQLEVHISVTSPDGIHRLRALHKTGTV
jgi:hypothetical protein